MRQKYPRTLHHPGSPGVQSDDKIASDLSAFQGAEVIVTEKMDGENTTLYRDGFHARSLDTGYHSSRDWLAGFHAQISYLISEGWRVCGENLYARHSVAYQALKSYFLGFSVWTDANRCQSWDDSVATFQHLGVEPVPVIYRGAYSASLLSDLGRDLDLDSSEGLVMRLSRQFDFSDFGQSVVKWVRPGHVQSETHWRNAEIVPNGLAGKAHT